MGMLRYHCVQLAQLFDVDVVYYDYGGYGASSGSPSAAGTVADAQVAADYVEELGVPWSRVILYGFSLGNGPTCALAGDVAGAGASGVILRSGFLLSMWHAERLLAALPEGRRAAPFFEDMGHFDVERHPAYVPRLRSFIHGRPRAPAA
ncbi:palmitoyl-(protein) hydrolase [Aureococcus anophagefferens]|nr:palmitoyl-(protein) hydrolase [Aureococcus anophagefferens]